MIHPESPARARYGASPGVSPSDDHLCQFYETDDFLSDSVAVFLADGLSLSHPVLLFSTPGRWQGVAAVLRTRGIDALEACEAGRVRILDAAEVLGRIMDGEMPDPVRFTEVLGAEIEQAMERTDGGRIRIFGEMVDLLCRDGNAAAAIRLEDLWNELRTTRDFQLLCAYSMGNVFRESGAGHLREIRRRHGRVAEEPVRTEPRRDGSGPPGSGPPGSGAPPTA